jgi:hypothetical protein
LHYRRFRNVFPLEASHFQLVLKGLSKAIAASQGARAIG